MMSKFLSIAAATAVLIGTTALGHAQSSGQRMPESTPGQKMQDRGSMPGQPGASGYTPGHQMQQKGSRRARRLRLRARPSGAEHHGPGQHGRPRPGPRSRRRALIPAKD
jgi:hypothetical protein